MSPEFTLLMQDYSFLHNDQLVFWGAIAIISVVGIVAPILYAYFNDKTRRQEDNDLISRMIEKGYSAEEIERILKARSIEDDA